MLNCTIEAKLKLNSSHREDLTERNLHWNSAKSLHFLEVEVGIWINLDNDISAGHCLSWDVRMRQILQHLLTFYDYVLPVGGRSSKMTEQGSAGIHLVARTRKLIRNADIDITSSIPTATETIENLNGFNNDSCAVIDGNPRRPFTICNTNTATSVICVSINAKGCSIVVMICRR